MMVNAIFMLLPILLYNLLMIVISDDKDDSSQWEKMIYEMKNIIQYMISRIILRLFYSKTKDNGFSLYGIVNKIAYASNLYDY